MTAAFDCRCGHLKGREHAPGHTAFQHCIDWLAFNLALTKSDVRDLDARVKAMEAVA